MLTRLCVGHRTHAELTIFPHRHSDFSDTLHLRTIVLQIMSNYLYFKYISLTSILYLIFINLMSIDEQVFVVFKSFLAPVVLKCPKGEPVRAEIS